MDDICPKAVTSDGSHQWGIGARPYCVYCGQVRDDMPVIIEDPTESIKKLAEHILIIRKRVEQHEGLIQALIDTLGTFTWAFASKFEPLTDSQEEGDTE